jgi:hypothetical protein
VEVEEDHDMVVFIQPGKTLHILVKDLDSPFDGGFRIKFGRCIRVKELTVHDADGTVADLHRNLVSHFSKDGNMVLIKSSLDPYPTLDKGMMSSSEKFSMIFFVI